MKAKALLAFLLSGTMALSVGMMAACKNKDKNKDKDQDQTQTGGDYTVDTTEYYLVGTGAGTLKQNDWSNTNHVLAMTRDESADHNVFTITIDMYAGDAFQIIHDDSWDGQMGIDYMYGVDEDGQVKDSEGNVIFIGGGMMSVDITLQPGYDGTYTFSLHTYPDGDKTAYITYNKDAELKALLDMYVVSDMNDFGFKQTAYEASHMTKRENDWKALLKIEESDLKRDAEGNKVTEGAQYAAVAVRNDVADDEGYQAVTCDSTREGPTAIIEGDEYNLLPAGDYTLIYNPETDTLTITDGAVEIFVAGNFTDWKADNKYVLTEDADGNWGTHISITEKELLDGKDYAELQLNNPYSDAWYSASADGNDYTISDEGNIQLTVGDYFIKYTTEGNKVEVEKMAYYIVGSVPNQNGEADDNCNFKLTEYSSVELEAGETEGVYTVTFGIPDCSTAYDWVAPNAFAFKVVYGTYLGGARDWYGDADGENLFVPEAGEYTISYNTETKEVEIVRVEYTVTFDLNVEGLTGAPEAQTVPSLNTVEAPADPEFEGYTFYGWYEDEACTRKFDFTSPIYNDTTLYARLIANADIPESVKVTFDADNGTEAVEVDTVKGLVAQPEDPEKEGFYFNGWYNEDGTEFNFDAFVNAAITVKADWTEIDTHEYHIVGNLKKGGIGEWDCTDLTLKLAQDPAYTNENVFTITLTLYEGDIFKIFGVTDWSGLEVNSGALRNTINLGDDYGNIKALKTGVYTLKFFRDQGWKLDNEYKALDIKNEVHFVVNETEGDKLSNVGSEWSGYITLNDGDVLKLIDKLDDSEYEVEITEAGEYFVKLDLESGEVSAAKCDYYLVGSFVDAEGAVKNFVIVVGLTPTLTLGENGKYTASIEVTDVTTVAGLEWVAKEGPEGSIFAIQVIYGSTDGTVKNWGNGNTYATEGAGTYTVTYDAAEGTTTFTKNA